MRSASKATSLYGLVAHYESPEEILVAARMAREAGYTKMDAFTPYMVEGLAEELRSRDDRVTWIVFGCGMVGAALGFLLQWWVSAVDYPMNIGGRPDVSWPSFIPVTFECGILSAALGGLVGMLMLNGLPLPYHPIFEAPGFERVTRDRFILCIESADPRFDAGETREFLESTAPEGVEEVRPK